MRERRRAYKDHIRITLTGKITATYLLLVFFSLIASGYALSSLHKQTKVSRALVHIEIKAAAMARDLQSELRTQERLSGQLTIRQTSEAFELLKEKIAGSEPSQRLFLSIISPDHQQNFSTLFSQYKESSEEFLKTLQEQKESAAVFYKNSLRPNQHAILDTLKDFRASQQQKIDLSLDQLSNDSDSAFRITMILLLLGLALSTPVGVSVILQMHRSLRKLTNATQQIAEGNYDLDIDTTDRDEFGQLTREFIAMGHKLREYEILNLDASPLTHLPGNLVIQRRVEELLQEGTSFAHAFVDLDHFKAFNDRYGYQKGSDIITAVAEILSHVVKEHGNPEDFIGHIGGDDYIFLTSTDKVEFLAQKFIEMFDRKIPEFYSEADREKGSFVGEDRFGVKRDFQIMTVSISIICSERSNYASATAISHECAKMKEHLKRLPGSNYLIDRRKGVS